MPSAFILMTLVILLFFMLIATAEFSDLHVMVYENRRLIRSFQLDYIYLRGVYYGLDFHYSLFAIFCKNV